MIFSCAIHDESGYVHRLCLLSEQPEGGLFKTQLNVAQSSWPTEPFPSAKLKVLNGSLAWEDLRTTEEAWADARHKRAPLLLASDWVAVRAFELQQPVPEQWATYRQALRDITLQADPRNLVWPAPPEQ